MERKGDEVHLNETEATAGVKAQGVRYRARHFAAAGRDRHVGDLDPGLGPPLAADKPAPAGQPTATFMPSRHAIRGHRDSTTAQPA